MSVWLYRSLGVAARINQATSHIRLKGVPFNWIVFAGLGLSVVWQGSEFINSLLESPQPRPVSIGDIKERTFDSAPLDYVTLQGHLFPESELRLGNAAYIPLIEADTRRAILVRANRKNRDELGPVLSSVTGRLQAIDPDRQIDVSQADLGHDVYLETAWSLAEGRRPNTAWKHGVIAGVTGGLLAVFASALAKQGIIFEASESQLWYRAVPLSDGVQIDLRISACLTLYPSIPPNDDWSNQSTEQQRFLDVPGTIGSSENGELVLMANVDASSRGGIAVADRKVGWWKSAITSKSIHNLETGFLHLGREQRPALRFHYNELEGEQMQAVLSFANLTERQHAINHLIHSVNTRQLEQSQ